MSQPLVAVVDDDPRIRELLATELEDLGAAVLRCREGSELLTQAELQQVELVLLDWMMPGLDGAGTLQALAESGFAGRVVVVTALCDPEVLQQAKAQGAVSTLLKTEALERLPALLRGTGASLGPPD
ncbi:response regulator [Synechococcus sp. CBW1107]|uniref:response regulator n=1 Tax=Synechococcus sp. CBW1107 TaxID=2789857 RepID=UPI002AD4CA79|nr:response regulator [Synechococcus sp. CBW1107]CAK6700386.1 Tetrathionate response regulatory protein TtrR [Synechococcus sp. CBW1107]